MFVVIYKMYPFRFEDASTGLSYLKTAQLDDTNYDNWIGAGTPRWISAMEVKRAVDDYLSKKGYAISTDDDCISALIFGSSTTSVQIKDHQIIGFKFSAKKDDEKIFIYAIGRPNLPEIENLAYDAQLNALLAKIMCVQPEKKVSFVFALPEDYKSRFIIKKHQGARYKFITLEDARVDFSIYFTNVKTGVVEERRWREFFG